MVQACLYPLGRSAEVFKDPQRFDPGRWGGAREEGQSAGGFRSLAFGFGARQCVGRRIAENEMQLLLMHVSQGGWSEGESIQCKRGGGRLLAGCEMSDRRGKRDLLHTFVVISFQIVI